MCVEPEYQKISFMFNKKKSSFFLSPKVTTNFAPTGHRSFPPFDNPQKSRIFASQFIWEIRLLLLLLAHFCFDSRRIESKSEALTNIVSASPTLPRDWWRVCNYH